MAYGKFKIEWKNFLLGVGAMFICLILPGISGVFSSIIENVRNMLPFGDNK